MYGVYIHIPFCIQKCLYCDFVSYTDKSDLQEKYISKVSEEMQKFSDKDVDSVFIGGGTPTILPVYLLEKLLYNVHNNFKISSDCEFSIEANPKTLSDDKINVLKKYTNRISIGVQSFNDKELKAIGRIHDAKSAYDTILKVRDNFENFNIDLMSNLPYQTKESFSESLKTAVSLEPPHISCYSLIVEEGTPLYDMIENKTLEIPDDDFDRDIYAFTKEYLQKSGYDRYEISNYAKKGFECRHNIKYWDTDEYLGFGAAAHSYADGKRYFNSGDINEYLSGKGGGYEELSRNDMMSEFVFMGMRKTKGISVDRFKRKFGVDIYDVYGDIIKEKIEKGLIEKKGGMLFLSERGIDISNYVLCDFII